MADKKNDQKKYNVKIDDSIEQGIFVNAVSVHFNRNECVIDLAYNIPNAKEPTIKVIERVNMTHQTAESFLKVFSNALLDFKNKSKENSQKNSEENN